MTLLPDKLNFTIWQGATFRTRLTLYTDAGVTLRDLTSYSASLIIRDRPKSPTTLLTLVSPTDIVLGGAAGTIDIVISATATAALTWTIGYYDLTITAPSAGDTDALIYGAFAVKGV